jgi:hypothetical protein
MESIVVRHRVGLSFGELDGEVSFDGERFVLVIDVAGGRFEIHRIDGDAPVPERVVEMCRERVLALLRLVRSWR